MRKLAMEDGILDCDHKLFSESCTDKRDKCKNIVEHMNKFLDDDHGIWGCSNCGEIVGRRFLADTQRSQPSYLNVGIRLGAIALILYFLLKQREAERDLLPRYAPVPGDKYYEVEEEI